MNTYEASLTSSAAVRSNHAPGHLRNAFLESLEGYYKSLASASARAALYAACGPLWKCTDILPSSDCDVVCDIVRDERRGYINAAALRRIRAHLS